jgi:bifunctional non-homologous end joining protein LigD
VIPKGNYGAGKVIVWDTGQWNPIGDPFKGYEKGDLKFELHGEKLKGQWALVRTNFKEAGKQEQWLLIKKSDAHAVPESKYDIVNQSPLSVLTGRDLDEVEQAKPAKPKESSQSRKSSQVLKPEKVSGARRSAMLTDVKVQLASAADRAPASDDWIHEIKLDGYRMTIFKNEKKVIMRTRNGLDWTKRFPTIAAAVAVLNGRDVVLDGEIVMLRPDGLSDFGELQQAINSSNEKKIVYFAFDLLYANGFDLRACPLIQRKRLLAQLLASGKPNHAIQFCEHVAGNGGEFFAQCRRLGVEGVMSKLVRSSYKSGRTDTWLKCKCILSDDFVIGGYTPSKKSRGRIAALLLGYYDDNKLVYAGKVGTGFSDESLEQLKEICDQSKTSKSSFVSMPAEVDVAGAVWARPVKVARVNYIGWSTSHQLRHASFIGLREDLSAGDVKTPASGVARNDPPQVQRKLKVQLSEDVLSQLADIKLSNPNKIYYPAPQVTKLDIATYYISVAHRLLPYISERPVSLMRYPEGIERDGFMQKHPGPNRPQWIGMVNDPESDDPLLEISSVQGLATSVQLGTLELHPWGSKSDRLDKPDRLIFDFDPDDEIGFSVIKASAVLCREILSDIGLDSFVKTTGGRGAHVIVPIERRNSWVEVLDFARLVASAIEKENPKLYTTNMSKQARGGKILIDIHRNHRGATCVAAYSVRARRGASVSMPLPWDEFENVENPSQFDIVSVSDRVYSEEDPWQQFYLTKQRLSKSMFASLRNRRLL